FAQLARAKLHPEGGVGADAFALRVEHFKRKSDIRRNLHQYRTVWLHRRVANDFTQARILIEAITVDRIILLVEHITIGNRNGFYDAHKTRGALIGGRE